MLLSSFYCSHVRLSWMQVWSTIFLKCTQGLPPWAFTTTDCHYTVNSPYHASTISVCSLLAQLYTYGLYHVIPPWTGPLGCCTSASRKVACDCNEKPYDGTLWIGLQAAQVPLYMQRGSPSNTCTEFNGKLTPSSQSTASQM